MRYAVGIGDDDDDDDDDSGCRLAVGIIRNFRAIKAFFVIWFNTLLKPLRNTAHVCGQMPVCLPLERVLEHLGRNLVALGGPLGPCWGCRDPFET